MFFFLKQDRFNRKCAFLKAEVLKQLSSREIKNDAELNPDALFLSKHRLNDVCFDLTITFRDKESNFQSLNGG